MSAWLAGVRSWVGTCLEDASEPGRSGEEGWRMCILKRQTGWGTEAVVKRSLTQAARGLEDWQ